MCKTHAKVNFKTMMNIVVFVFYVQGESKVDFRRKDNTDRQEKRINTQKECWWSQLGVGHICSLPDSDNLSAVNGRPAIHGTDEMWSVFPSILMKLSKVH